MNDDTDLPDDVARSMDVLLGQLNIEDEPKPDLMGMSPADLAGTFKMKLVNWVRENQSQAIKTFAVIHATTGDILNKHTERNPSEIAQEALEE